MRSLHLLCVLGALSLATSCVEAPRSPPPPAAPPQSVRMVAPPPPAAPAVLATDWRDRPQTPGDWRYASAPAGGSVARFGNADGAAFAIRCAAGRVTLELAATSPAPITIRTSSLTRVLTATLDAQGRAVAGVAATDPLLDAIGFSRGRFVVEQAGAAPLALPAWAEVERVVEDCRG